MELFISEADNVTIVRVDGGIDTSTAPQLKEAITGLIETGINRIILDCEKVRFISSAGLGMLVIMHRQMKKAGGDVKIASVKGIVFDVLRMTHLDTLFEVYDDVERARLAFRPKAEAQASSTDA